MRIELYHASHYGNGAKVAEELKRLMESRGHQLNVHHVDDSDPRALPTADLYIFGSPTRMGGPIRSMRGFTKKAVLPAGTRYAIFATCGDIVPNKKTGKMMTEEEVNKWRRTIPDLDEILQERGMVKVAEKVFLVDPNQWKGPLLDDWEKRAEEFTEAILAAQ